MSLFRRSKSKTQLSSSSAPSTSAGAPPPPPLPPIKQLRRKDSSQSLTVKHVDDFGRVIERPAPAFVTEGSPYLGADQQDELDGAEPREFALLYGYSPLETTLELTVQEVELLCVRCAAEIRTRG